MQKKDSRTEVDDCSEKQCYLESPPSRKRAWLRRLIMLGMLGLLLWFFNSYLEVFPASNESCSWCRLARPVDQPGAEVGDMARSGRLVNLS